MKAKFNSNAALIVRRNRDLAATYLEEKCRDSRVGDVFNINTDRNTLANGIGMLTDDQLELFVEKFPEFTAGGESAESESSVESTLSTDVDFSYPDLVSRVEKYWKKHNLVPTAVAVLEANNTVGSRN